ncbi:MAG: hypothetical protein ABI573_08700 [Chloroflexota bacterium]
MRLGWIGSRLLGGGIAVFIGGYVLAVMAVPYANLVTGFGMAVTALSAAAVCISPRPPFVGRLARFGLGLLAIGAGGLLISNVIAAGMTFDPLESAPVVLFGVTGLLLTPVGLLLIGIALARRYLSRG